MRERWGQRRKPIPMPDVQPRRRGPHTWHWWDLLPIAFFGWVTFDSLRDSSEWWHFLVAGWFAAVLVLLSWGFAMPKDGSLGEMARRMAATTRGRVVAWSLFIWILFGIAYAVYWTASHQ